MTGIYPSRPFTRSKAKNLNYLQAMFRKRKEFEEIDGHQRRTYNAFTLYQIEKEEIKRPCVQMALS